MIGEFSRVSVIVPTHSGFDRLPRLLESLEHQTLDRRAWEVVFVCNGPDDGSMQLLLKWSEGNDITSRVLTTPESGAGLARNLGIASSRGSIITFVDDDDWIEPRFLEVGRRHSSEGCIALLPFKEAVNDSLFEDNSLNLRRRMLSGSSIPVHGAPWALGFNACKFVPATLLKRWRYKEHLASGEDVVFFANLLAVENLQFTVPRDEARTAYVRTIREDSVSRRPKSFDFNVAQRLDVIAELRKMPVAPESVKALESLISSQFGFVVERLQAQPGELSRAARYSIAVGAYGLDWKRVHKQPAKRLIFSYCFPPFADPAANVVAKRISQDQEVVDVVSADMSAVREIDASALVLVDPWVQNHHLVRSQPSFASWPAIADYAQKAVRAVNRAYSSLYSRALWSGSHVAGALYKMKYPSVVWKAEFSDPMRWDARGNPRAGGPANGIVARKLNRGLKLAGWCEELGACKSDHFALTELATLVLADEVVFTNQNQMDLVLSSYSESFGQMVRAKSSVLPQPVPPKEAYESTQVDLQLNRGKVNLAYFGNFYANRGLGDYAAALDHLPPNIAEDFVLHVFSTEVNDSVMERLIFGGQLVHHEPLSYLEFLAACKHFDALLVVDAATAGTSYERNPFLPSKLSDYMGSETPVWAIVEQDSPLSHISTEFQSLLGDPKQAMATLVQIARMRE